MNPGSISIKGDEKVKLQVKNADSDDVTYSSNDETVPINFGDMTLIFYADKDLIQGGYIEGLFNENSGESEVLFNPGIKVKILDVGVRYVKMTALTDDNEDLNGYHYERYVKCALVPVVN